MIGLNLYQLRILPHGLSGFAFIRDSLFSITILYAQC